MTSVFSDLVRTSLPTCFRPVHSITQRMKSTLLVLVLGLAYISADDVVELGDSDFDSKLADMDTALVMFYAPW